MIRCIAIMIFCLYSICSVAQPVSNTYPYKRYFPKKDCSQNAFSYAMRGYTILKEQGLLANPRYLTIIDYTKRSDQKRFFVLDLVKGRTVISSITAHGIGSDPDSITFPVKFSNTEGSKASSLGFYITGDTYYNHRPPDSVGLCLFGLDKGYNDSAATREIVIHAGALEYSGTVYVRNMGAKRSYGCPALPVGTNSEVIDLIKGGSCLFIYSNKVRNYAENSSVLQDRLDPVIYQQGPPPNNCSCNLRGKER
jgi:hypothetical protein